MDKKYLIHHCGGGLVHMLMSIQKAVNICKKDNKILIIDSTKASCFKDNISTFFDITENIGVEYYENYNYLLSIFKKDDIICEKENLTVNDIIKYNESSSSYITKIINNFHIDKGCGKGYIFPKFLKINNYTQEFIKEKNKNIKNFTQNNNYIGVHYRGTDRPNDLKKILENIIENSKKNNIKNIYLATDEYSIFYKIKSFVEENKLKFFYTSIPFDTQGKPLHFTYKNKHELVLNVLADMYFLYKSKIFIPSIKSNISKWIIEMKKNNYDIF